MSRSDRGPAEETCAAPAEDLLPEVPWPWLVWMTAVPAKARSAMRTVDPVNRPGPLLAEETNTPFLVARASNVLGQLELAAKERAVTEMDITRLGFSETRNGATGEWAIIVREQLSPGRYSRPLAELLSTGGELTEGAREQANCLGWSAANRRLEIVLFKEFDEKFIRATAFAAVRTAGRPQTVSFRLLARILVTPFEISQWADPFVETKVDSVS